MMAARPKPLRFGFARCGRCGQPLGGFTSAARDGDAAGAPRQFPPDPSVLHARAASPARPRRLAASRARAGRSTSAAKASPSIARPVRRAATASSAFAHDLPPEKRTDRVIAEEWDAAFALFDGDPSRGRYRAAGANVPRQEAGRVSRSRKSCSRAPTRACGCSIMWRPALAAGRQPQPEDLANVGYLMRTTAVYGSGKFGLAVREAICGRPGIRRAVPGRNAGASS